MRRSSIAALLFAFTTACGGAASDSSGDTAAAAGGPAPAATAENCIVGTYTQASPSFSPKFVFNADGTGEETRAASQGGGTRAFTWTRKSDSELTITFPAVGDEAASSMDWNYSCQNNTFASIYRKE